MNDEQKRKLAEKLALWRRDYVQAVCDLFNIEPTWQQKELLAAASNPTARVGAVSGHGSGKTSSLAWIILLLLLTERNIKIPCTAGSVPQLESALIPECEKWYYRLPKFFKDQLLFKSREIVQRAAPYNFAVFRTARKGEHNTLAGFHEDNVCFIVDEAPTVEDAVFEVARGGLTGGSESGRTARWLLTGNPVRTSGHFYDVFHTFEGWTKLHFNSEESPLVSKQWIDEMKRDYGEDSDAYKVRVLGEFPAVGLSELISRDAVDLATQRTYPVNAFNSKPKILGVDLSSYGDDQSSVILRQGLSCRIVSRFEKLPAKQIVQILHREIVSLSPQAVFIDNGSIGPAIIDLLKDHGHRPLEVNFGGKPFENDKEFANQRAYMWCKMRDWLEDGGHIPNDRTLVDQLCSPEYFFTATGKIQLEKKNDLKARVGFSPDLADALALTFARPVTMRDERGDFRTARRREFDPLSFSDWEF